MSHVCVCVCVCVCVYVCVCVFPDGRSVAYCNVYLPAHFQTLHSTVTVTVVHCLLVTFTPKITVVIKIKRHLNQTLLTQQNPAQISLEIHGPLV